MLIKKRTNVFVIVNGKIEYTDIVKQAVLDPKITFNNLHMNGGWDYIDMKYQFIKLLISRGQITKIETHQDLFGMKEYLEAAKLGVSKSYGIEINFIPKRSNKNLGCASEKRVLAAKKRWTDFCERKTVEALGTI